MAVLCNFNPFNIFIADTSIQVKTRRRVLIKNEEHVANFINRSSFGRAEEDDDSLI